MTTMCAYAAPHAGRRREGHFGAWRSVAALPAMIGSLLTLLVLFSWLGAWEGLVLLGWLASGAAVFTGPGERVAVRIGCGFRRPTAQQTAVLAPLWAQALAYAQLRRDQVEPYVQRTRDPNAYAAGGRSVAVTTGAVDEFQARRLGVAHTVAILTHEIGHVETRATQYALVTMWLSAPWRFLSRLVTTLALTFAHRQPRRLLALVVVAGVVVAIVQAIQQQHWTVAVVLGGVAAAAMVCPLADAAVSRRSEYAADGYAARIGLGPHLALALEVLNGGRGRRPGWSTRIVSRHPDVGSRIGRLNGYPNVRTVIIDDSLVCWSDAGSACGRLRVTAAIRQPQSSNGPHSQEDGSEAHFDDGCGHCAAHPMTTRAEHVPGSGSSAAPARDLRRVAHTIRAASLYSLSADLLITRVLAATEWVRPGSVGGSCHPRSTRPHAW